MTDQSTGRREFYAAMALTDLPMPQRITIEADHVRLIFDSIAAIAAWAYAFGVEIHSRYDADDAQAVASGWGTFAGRGVWLCGREPAPAPEPALTGATRERLVVLTREVD